MAGRAGFEPANAGIKTRCLTTWRPANSLPQTLEQTFQSKRWHYNVHPEPNWQAGAEQIYALSIRNLAFLETEYSGAIFRNAWKYGVTSKGAGAATGSEEPAFSGMWSMK